MHLWLIFLMAVVVLAATAPLTIWGVRFARRRRGMASGALTLLLMFGVSVRIDPPPRPRIEAVHRKEKEAEDDEPK